MHHYEDPRAASIEALKTSGSTAGAGCRMVRSTRSLMCRGGLARRRRCGNVLQPDLPPAGWSLQTSVIRQRGLSVSTVIRVWAYAYKKAEHQNQGKRYLMAALRCCQLAAWGIRDSKPNMMIDEDINTHLTPEAISNCWSGINEKHYPYSKRIR